MDFEYFKTWLFNIPYYLIEVFICKLVGHKPASFSFYGMTLCQRCYANFFLADRFKQSL